MKRLFLCLLLTLGVLVLAGCQQANTSPAAQPSSSVEGTTLPTESLPASTEPTTEDVTQPTQTQVTEAESTQPEATEPVTTEPEVTEPEETEPAPTEPKETEPKETEPKETEPKETEPAPTEPKETEPKETEPAPTEPQQTEPEETEPVTTEPEEPTEEESPDLLSSGWQERNGKMYYRLENGDLQSGWMVLDGYRYYFREDYSMAIGCVEVPGYGKTYFDLTGKEVILANPWNMIPEGYTVKLGSHGGYSMAKHIVGDLKQMLADCKAAGHTAVVCSAYRRHEDQVYLHKRRIQRFLDQGYSEEKAKIEAAKRVAIPGTSEHELGLALDIVDVNYQQLTEKQETMPAQKWLMANSWKYGFILRYPNEKSEITGIIYEPWHYRYVGKELAKEIYESGLCLEEYLQQLPTE